MTQVIPVILLNCSGRSKISDRKEQRKVIDLEMHGPAKQPRQNPTTKIRKATELLYNRCHCLNQLGNLCWGTFPKTYSTLDLSWFLPFTASPAHWVCFHPYSLGGESHQFFLTSSALPEIFQHKILDTLAILFFNGKKIKQAVEMISRLFNESMCFSSHSQISANRLCWYANASKHPVEQP